MGESSEIALTYAKIFLRELSPQNDFLDTVGGPRGPAWKKTNRFGLVFGDPGTRELFLN